MTPTSDNSAAAKTFLALQTSGVRDSSGYLESLKDILNKIEIMWAPNIPNHSLTRELALNEGINFLISNLKSLSLRNRKLIIVGNGGSAAIALHSLVDFANAGGIKTIDLFNPSLLTCMANDYGYENVFSKPIEILAEKGDVLFAISSSGQSPNILKACESALSLQCLLVTFSGFSMDNPLRKLGHLNFYVPSTHYGFIELAHQILLHCILDLFVRGEVYEKMRETLG